VGIRTKNTAIDFANNPKTVTLKKAQASLGAISTRIYRISSENKFRALLSLIQEEIQQGHSSLVIFCNLRQTSREVEARLRLNSIHGEHVSAAAPKAKNEALFKQFSERRAGDGQGTLILVVSNDNLEVLPSEFAAVAIHYDIPLDADVYLERVRAMHTRDAAMIGLACERYEVGLSAITSRFGIQFEIKEPSAEMQGYPDASEGIPLELDRGRPVEDQRPARRPEWHEPEIPQGPSDRQNKNRQESRRPRSKHTRRNDHAPASHDSRSGEHDKSLYSMSTEERLAYFRNKYRNILKTPVEPPQQQNMAAQTKQESPDSRETDNSGIVKRFIDKLLPGNKNSGQDSERQ